MNYLIYPTKCMNITQSYLGAYSHAKSYNGKPQGYPWDEADKDTSKSYFYCPCDEIQIKRIYGVGNGGTNTIWLQSTTKVKTPTFEDYITISITHPNDNTLKPLKVGQKFTRKQSLFTEGADGQATGNHFHIEIARGLFSKLGNNGWAKNSLSTWNIGAKAEKPENCFYIDKDFTTIKNNRDLIFITLPKYFGEVVEKNIYVDQLDVIIENLRVRKSPNGEKLGYANKGLYNYSGSELNGDYVWYNIGDNLWVASDKSWLKIIPKTEKIIDIPVEDGKQKLMDRILELIKLIIEYFKK